MATTLENKAFILSTLWMDYRNDQNFQDFIEYNDLGLPLAYALDSGMIDKNDRVITLIDEAFDLLLNGLDLEDTGFDDLDQLLSKEN